MSAWTATVLTLFPDMFPGPLGESLSGRALSDGRWSLDTVELREFAADRHASVDDEPFGGGPGMVLRPDVADSALSAAANIVDADAPIIYLTPRGRPLDQERVRDLADGAAPETSAELRVALGDVKGFLRDFAERMERCRAPRP